MMEAREFRASQVSFPSHWMRDGAEDFLLLEIAGGLKPFRQPEKPECFLQESVVFSWCQMGQNLCRGSGKLWSWQGKE